ncbi:MAG TPA: DUF3606 domain-containing protein [Usitatibacter sp.]|nr:DUF3606 domain-containing protein [Usitatibacter sp.]
MEDRKTKSPPDNSFQGEDPRVIDVEQAAERAYWCKSLGITEPQLLALVAAVGTSAQRVKDSLVAVRSSDD